MANIRNIMITNIKSKETTEIINIHKNKVDIYKNKLDIKISITAVNMHHIMRNTMKNLNLNIHPNKNKGNMNMMRKIITNPGNMIEKDINMLKIKINIGTTKGLKGEEIATLLQIKPHKNYILKDKNKRRFTLLETINKKTINHKKETLITIIVKKITTEKTDKNTMRTITDIKTMKIGPNIEKIEINITIKKIGIKNIINNMMTNHLTNMKPIK